MPRKIVTFLSLILLVVLPSCAPKSQTPLVVFAAGSLINPFSELETAFEAKYPDIDLQAEYHGSIQVIRHCTDLHEKIDVIATADQTLIPSLMYEVHDPDTGLPYANWYLRFATNSLGIAYTPNSKYADEINADNWMEILMRPDVKVGIADPRFDASGYRTFMIYKLAEQTSGYENLFNEMFADQFRFPLDVDEGGNMAIIRVPEVMETNEGSHIVIRGASVQLLALLESGDLDYAFEYDSVIKQHQLELIHLPDELNLSNAEFNSQYSNITVILDFQRFASVKPEFTGEQIGYGVTIPSDAPHPKEAKLFIQFLLGLEGRQIMEKNAHPMFEPAIADGLVNMPENLQVLASQP